MLNENTKANLKLFNRPVDPQDDPQKVYPLMTGFIESADFKKNVAAFVMVNKEGQLVEDSNGNNILSLVIGNKDDEKSFYGKLYKDMKPGKEGSYFGYITETVDTGEVDADGKKVYQFVWELKISGKRFTPQDTSKKKYIGCEVYPGKAQVARAATAEDELFF